MNFTTTLTPATALARHSRHSVRPHLNADHPPAPRVDYSTPALSEALASLAHIHTTSASDSTDVSLYVKIAAPITIRVSPSSAHPESTILSSVTANIASDHSGIIENFMSSWTTLVGDPVMSKWIVLILGISVFLNGYLLKGIAAGSGLPSRKGGVRFRSRAAFRTGDASEPIDSEEKVKHGPSFPAVIMPSIGPVVAEAAPAPPAPVPAPIKKVLAVDVPKQPSQPQGLSLPVDLNTVDALLEKERLTAERLERAKTEDVRPLAELVDIFENGPRPVSASLALLTDEEVILLCQTGKIAAYALEKVLNDLERAVSIRRALICESLRLDISIGLVSNHILQLVLPRRRPSRALTFPCCTTTTLSSWVLAVKTSSVTCLFLSVSLVLSRSMASSTLFLWLPLRALLSLQRLEEPRLSTLVEASLLLSRTTA